MRIQRLLCAVITVVSVFACALCVSAAEVTYDGFVYDVSGGKATLIKASATVPETVSVPEKVSGSNVTAIGNNAFYGCKTLKEIILPVSVTTVGDMAFSGCTNLEKVTYSGLTSVGTSSFANCTSLTTFEGSSALENVGECAFWNNKKLTHVDTRHLKNISAGAFWNCFGNDEKNYYRIADGTQSIAEGGYGNITYSYVTVPESVTSIASTAFGTPNDTIYVVAKGSEADKFFSSNGNQYKKINYGDINGDKNLTSSDIRAAATYVAKGTEVASDNSSKAIIADIDGDGKISTRDLFEILKSLR